MVISAQPMIGPDYGGTEITILGRFSDADILCVFMSDATSPESNISTLAARPEEDIPGCTHKAGCTCVCTAPNTSSIGKTISCDDKIGEASLLVEEAGGGSRCDGKGFSFYFYSSSPECLQLEQVFPTSGSKAGGGSVMALDSSGWSWITSESLKSSFKCRFWNSVQAEETALFQPQLTKQVLCSVPAFPPGNATPSISLDGGQHWLPTSNTTQYTFLPCPAGTASLATTDPCVSCASGRFSPSEGTASCLSTPAGTYAASPGATNYSLCLPGSHAPFEAMSDCTACGVGRFSSTNGQSACTHCILGHYTSTTGVSVCAQCQAGHYASSTGRTDCEACTAGNFAAVNGATSCNECEHGRFSPEAGRTSCYECAAGWFAGHNGLQECSRCLEGRFTNSSGATGCAKCSVGQFALGPGTTHCYACGEGLYTAVLGSSVCLACAPGHHTNTSAGASECVACGTGQYAQDGGRTVCRQCSPGLYSSQTGATACESCALGHYTSSYATTACTHCNAGSSGEIRGLTACQDCFPGKISPVAGAIECISCGSQGYTGATGATACDACPVGSAVSSKDLARAPATSIMDCKCSPEDTSYMVVKDSSFICVDCPVDVATCSGQLHGIVPRAGHWYSVEDMLVSPTLRREVAEDTLSDSPSGTIIFECPTAEWCLGGVNGTCKEGHEGALCSRCSAGWIMGFSSCEQCDDMSSAEKEENNATLFGIAGAIIFFCVLLFAVAQFGCSSKLVFDMPPRLPQQELQKAYGVFRVMDRSAEGFITLEVHFSSLNDHCIDPLSSLLTQDAARGLLLLGHAPREGLSTPFLWLAVLCCEACVCGRLWTRWIQHGGSCSFARALHRGWGIQNNRGESRDKAWT